METDHQANASCMHQNVGSLERAFSIVTGAVTLLGAIRRRGVARLLFGVAGGALLYRGASGHCNLYEKLGIDTSKPANLENSGTEVVETITINRSPSDVYRFCRDLTHFPEFIPHLTRVETRGNGESRWIASGPGGKEIQWDARITGEVANERLSWETLPGADLESRGSLRLEAVPGGKGTKVTVSLCYRPPLGKLGVVGAWLLHQAPGQQLRQGLRNLRQLLEAGELATAQAS